MKRKLCVDYKTCFPIPVLKKNMINTFDITTVLDLAPTTKRLMNLKQTGCVESLLSRPSLKLQNPKLFKVRYFIFICNELNTIQNDKFRIMFYCINLRNQTFIPYVLGLSLNLF